MVKLPPLFYKVVQTSSETTCEVHVRVAVNECENNDSTSLLVCVTVHANRFEISPLPDMLICSSYGH
eukprot:1464-Heterococcus_DN1.PRE.1